jgi:hypothetical protein
MAHPPIVPCAGRDRLPTRPPADQTACRLHRLPSVERNDLRGNAIHSPADDVRIVGAQGHSACMVMSMQPLQLLRRCWTLHSAPAL